MKKDEMIAYVGRRVFVCLKNSKEVLYGRLGYVKEFSDKYGYRQPYYFFIGHTSFKASHVRKIIESEEYND
mgnify:CR=1 FL=1